MRPDSEQSPQSSVLIPDPSASPDQPTAPAGTEVRADNTDELTASTRQLDQDKPSNPAAS